MRSFGRLTAFFVSGMLVVAAAAPSSAHHEPPPAVAFDHIGPVTASPERVSHFGNVTFGPAQGHGVNDEAGETYPPGADILSSTVRALSPTTVEFVITTTRQSVILPDGTTATPGGAALAYTWEVRTQAPPPLDRFRVQARRGFGPSTIQEPVRPLFEVLTHHDGITYNKANGVPGSFTDYSVRWTMDTRNGVFEGFVPTGLTVSTATHAGPYTPHTANAQRDSILGTAVPLDTVETFTYEHPQPPRVEAEMYTRDWYGPRRVVEAQLSPPGFAQSYRYDIVFDGPPPSPWYAIHVRAYWGYESAWYVACGYSVECPMPPGG